MTKIYVWPDATYLDASEYNEVEFNHKGEDLITIDLQEIVDGRTVLVDTGGFFTVVPVFECRLSELLQAEHQFKATTTMFANYRNTMREMTWEIPQLRETIKKLEADYQGALRRITELEQSLTAEELARLSRELSDVIASKDQEIKTILAARDQWVKELQGKLREATSSESWELLEENRRLKSQLAGATARIRKQIDGYDAQAKLAEWKGRAEAAEAELAKLKNTSAISSDMSPDMSGDIEDNLRKERDRYATLLAKHGVCTDCGDMYEHHEDEPLASCSCQTAEWSSGVSTPYMALQRALREARDAEQCQAEKAEEFEFARDQREGEIADMKRNISAAIRLLQEIE